MLLKFSLLEAQVTGITLRAALENGVSALVVRAIAERIEIALWSAPFCVINVTTITLPEQNTIVAIDSLLGSPNSNFPAVLFLQQYFFQFGLLLRE